MNYFISAIGTDCGKTVISAILVEALKADYWKPIQAGLPRDTETVKSLVSNNESAFQPEAYLLNTPASPHYAAAVDGISIDIGKISLPASKRDLIIEGAGGILVPLNEKDSVVDMVKPLNSEVILVANLYLGSINHTLLTVEALKRRNIKVKGLIFNGEANKASQDIILQKSGYPQLLHVKKETEINQVVVKKYADLLLKNWNGL